MRSLGCIVFMTTEVGSHTHVCQPTVTTITAAGTIESRVAASASKGRSLSLFMRIGKRTKLSASGEPCMVL